MKIKKIPRNETTYVLLLEALQKNEDVNSLDTLLGAMKKDGVRATDIFYSKIIGAYASCGAFDKVRNLNVNN